MRKKVNDLLATGASYAMVSRALAAYNAELDVRERGRSAASVTAGTAYYGLRWVPDQDCKGDRPHD